jgi:hypothetical protein
MIFAYLVIAAIARLALIFAPAYTEYSVTQYYPVIAQSLAFDILFAITLVLMSHSFGKKFSRFMSLFTLAGLTLLNGIVVASVSYFGWTLSFEHVHLLTSTASVSGVVSHLSSSKICIFYALFALVTFTCFVFSGFSKTNFKPISYSFFFAVGLLTVGLLSQKNDYFNGDAPTELTLPPVLVLASKYLEYQRNNPDLSTFAHDDQTAIRENFDPNRPWKDSNPKTPLAQSSLWQPKSSGNPRAEHLYQQLGLFLQNRERRESLNIVLLQIESLRAHELTQFGTASQEEMAASPFLTNFFQSSLRFSEIIATGDLTHYGELATGCSVAAQPFFNTLLQAPNTPLTCLPDVLASKGYDTHFFNGTNGNTNNRNVFYPSHGTKNLWSLESFPGETQRQGWGLTDKTMYRTALDILSMRRSQPKPSPFFAHILTLSSHSPFLHPVDANFPAGQFSSKITMLKYIDESIADFTKRLYDKFPNTLLIITADHGEWPEEGFSKRNISYDQIRKHHRIPLVFYHPDFPSELKNQDLNVLGSDVDTAPTLLSSLGITEFENDFMGENIFRRSEPIIVKYGNYWLSLLEANKSSENLEDVAWNYKLRMAYGRMAAGGHFSRKINVGQTLETNLLVH